MWRQTLRENSMCHWRQKLKLYSCKDSQRLPAITRSKEEARKDSTTGVREHGLLTSWFGTYRPQNYCSLVLCNKFVVLCYNSPRKLMHGPTQGELMVHVHAHKEEESFQRTRYNRLSGPKVDCISPIYYLLTLFYLLPWLVNNLSIGKDKFREEAPIHSKSMAVA